MTRKELYNALEKRIPSSLSCPWDNDGVMLCMDPDREVKKVVTCLDVCEKTVKAALDMGADLIISHHPMIFRPLKRLDCSERTFSLAASLIASNIAVFSFHTRLDAVEGGLNDRLASLLGLQEVRAVDSEEGPLVRLGRMEECAPAEFAQGVSNALQTAVRCYEGSRRVRRVMSVCGGGKDFLPLALEMGVDAFVSGDLSYNAAMEACEQGLTVLDATHRATELPVCALLSELVCEICPTLTVMQGAFGGEDLVFTPKPLAK